jgi:hypothetical protein
VLVRICDRAVAGVPQIHEAGGVSPALNGTTVRAFRQLHLGTLPELRVPTARERFESSLEERARLEPRPRASLTAAERERLAAPPLEVAFKEFAVYGDVSVLLVHPEVFFYGECRHDPRWVV